MVISQDNLEAVFQKAMEYFSLKLQIPRDRRDFKSKKTVFERLLREFASAAKVDVSEGSTNRVYLHAIVSFAPQDFKLAMQTYTLRTKNLELFPGPRSKSIFDLGSKDIADSFVSYVESLRRKRMLERFFMGIAKDMDKLERKKSDREREQDSVNKSIERNKVSGWKCVEDSEAKEEKKKQEGRGG